ncbi:unnamed protein product, partial [Mesorhabditis belari]|uniref:SH3 domain-containing protein n=1 Tax=Mesorhabditis belari TaxID=2138241 RepID=A0AAF3FBY1_9BILA
MYAFLESATFNPGELAELTRLTREEQMYRQKAERLTEELEAQRSRRHGYIPSAAPALQKNVERFTGLLNEYGRDSPSNGLQSASPMPAGRRSTVGSSAPTNVLTCTCIYKFTAHNESTPEEPTLCLPHPVAENTQQTNGITPNHPNPQTYQMSRQNNPNSSYSTSSFPGIDKTRRFNDYEEETDKLTEWSNRRKAPNLSSSTTRGDPPISSAQQHSSHIVPQNSETYRALYPYVPMNEDELELQVNDIVFVVEKCDDGWFIGTLLRNGQFGTFPGNYVVRH